MNDVGIINEWIVELLDLEMRNTNHQQRNVFNNLPKSTILPSINIIVI